MRADLVVGRNVHMMVLAFFGFLRFSDLGQLRLRDVTVEDRYVRIFIRDSKTDPEGKGQTVVVAKNAGKADPVSSVEDYKRRMQHSNKEVDQENFYFPSMRRCRGNKEVFVFDKKPMSYDTARKAVLEEASKHGVNVERLGTHSMRIGGAIEFTRRGVSDTVVTNHGRWRCVTSRLAYQRTLRDELVETGHIFQ